MTSRRITEPSPLPRSDRVLCHYFQESVRDYISNHAYTKLSLQAKGAMGVLRHYLWHSGVLPLDFRELSQLTRIPEAELELRVPEIIEAGFFLATKDGKHFWCPELEAQIGAAVKQVLRLKANGQKGGEASGETRRAKAAEKAPAGVVAGELTAARIAEIREVPIPF